MKILNKKILITLIIVIIFSFLVWLIFTYSETNKQKENTNDQQLTSSTSFKTYHNDEFGFEFQYPSDWITKESPYGSPSGKFSLDIKPFIRSAKEEYSTFMFVDIVTPDYIDKIKGIKSSIAITVDNIQGKKYTNDYGMIFIELPFKEEMIILGTSEQYENVLNQIVSTFIFFTANDIFKQEIGNKLYHNDEYDFEFQYPSDWKIMENTFRSPASKFNLIVVPTIGGYLPDPVFINIVTPEFANRAFSDLENDATEINVGGIKGKKYEYEFESLDQISIDLPFDEYHVFLGAKKVYEYIFNQVLSTLKFLK